MNLPLDMLSLEEVVLEAERFIFSKKPHHIVVLNAAKMVYAQYDAELAHIIQTADLVGADGVPVVWFSKWMGVPLPGRVNGTDLMERLIARASQKGYTVYFLGATKGVLKQVVKEYRKTYPFLKIAGYRDGYFSKEEETDVVEEIKKATPDILFIGLPTPQKEKWVYRHKEALNVPVCHGVGGSFDLVAGVVHRAPRWMQRSGLEWLYRLCQEPRRMWRRYLVTNTLFLGYVIYEWIRRRV